MAGKDADNALILLLAMMKNADEDAKTRKILKGPLSPEQVVKYRAAIRRNRDDHLFPVDKFYVRRRKDGRYYLVRSRRIHSDNLIKPKKGAFKVDKGAII